MSMLQGNTYLMPIRICDADGGVIKGEQVEKGEFVFGDLVKFYGGAEGEVVWDESREAFILPLSEEETFGFKGVVEYQGRVLLKDGSVSGSVPKSEDVYASIGTARLSDGGAGEESGEILTIRLLDRVINTGITEEVDPTVPQYVKEISKQDIENWNKVNKLGNVFKYKGSVQTYADLPTENNQVGDTYNVIEAYGEYGAGTNFAWSDAGEWDALGGVGGAGSGKYLHNITLVGDYSYMGANYMNSSRMCFSLINEDSEPYDTGAKVIKALQNWSGYTSGTFYDVTGYIDIAGLYAKALDIRYDNGTLQGRFQIQNTTTITIDNVETAVATNISRSGVSYIYKNPQDKVVAL